MLHTQRDKCIVFFCDVNTLHRALRIESELPSACSGSSVLHTREARRLYLDLSPLRVINQKVYLTADRLQHWHEIECRRLTRRVKRMRCVRCWRWACWTHMIIAQPNVNIFLVDAVPTPQILAESLQIHLLQLLVNRLLHALLIPANSNISFLNTVSSHLIMLWFCFICILIKFYVF